MMKTMRAAAHIQEEELEQEELASASETEARSSPLPIDGGGVQLAGDLDSLAEAPWLELIAAWELSEVEDMLPGLL